MNILYIEDLAKMLRISRSTLISRMSKDPDSLPPWVKAPGNRNPMWRESDIDDWLERNVRKSRKSS